MAILLDPNQALLLIIDIQEKFRSVIWQSQEMIESAQRMVQGCSLLNIPILISEQYPQGLGPTMPELTAHLPETALFIEKTAFGCYGEPRIQEAIERFNRPQILVCGLEAHICVNQTVVRLLEEDYQVYLIEEAIGARTETNYRLGLKKLYQLGAISSGVEMALFELLGGSGHPQFKAIQRLIK